MASKLKSSVALKLHLQLGNVHLRLEDPCEGAAFGITINSLRVKPFESQKNERERSERERAESMDGDGFAVALGVPVVEEPSAIPSPSERPPTPSRFIGATQLTATTLDGGDDDDEEGQQDDDVSDSDVRRWDSNLRPLHCCPIAEGRPFESRVLAGW